MSDRPFSDTLPDDRCYDRKRDMWVRQCADGSVEIGVTAFGLQLAGSVIAFTPKPKGAEIDCGRGLGTIETGKTVLAVHCPLSLTMSASNEQAEEHPSLLERFPYGAGWMIRGTPTRWEAERPDLVDAAAYREHCLSLLPDAEIGVGR